MNDLCPCASLPAEEIGCELSDRPALAAVVDQFDEEIGLALYHRCRVCGCVWEQNLASAMHATVPVLRRSDLDDAGVPIRLYIDLATDTRGPVERVRRKDSAR